MREEDGLAAHGGTHRRGFRTSYSARCQKDFAVAYIWYQLKQDCRSTRNGFALLERNE